MNSIKIRKVYVRAFLVFGFLLLDGYQHAFVDGYLSKLYEPVRIYEKIKLVFLGAFMVSFYEFFFILYVVLFLYLFSKFNTKSNYLSLLNKKVERGIKLVIVIFLMSGLSYFTYYVLDIGIDYRKDLVFYEHMFSSVLFGVGWLLVDWRYMAIKS